MTLPVPFEGESIWCWTHRVKRETKLLPSSFIVDQSFFPRCSVKKECAVSWPDMQQWLQDNCHIDNFLLWGHDIYFSDANEMVMFKLTWSDHLEST